MVVRAIPGSDLADELAIVRRGLEIILSQIASRQSYANVKHTVSELDAIVVSLMKQVEAADRERRDS